eukprot:4547199-Pyramimonas_sp.AAC.2
MTNTSTPSPMTPASSPLASSCCPPAAKQRKLVHEAGGLPVDHHNNNDNNNRRNDHNSANICPAPLEADHADDCPAPPTFQAASAAVGSLPPSLDLTTEDEEEVAGLSPLDRALLLEHQTNLLQPQAPLKRTWSAASHTAIHTTTRTSPSILPQRLSYPLSPTPLSPAPLPPNNAEEPPSAHTNNVTASDSDEVISTATELSIAGLLSSPPPSTPSATRTSKDAKADELLRNMLLVGGAIPVAGGMKYSPVMPPACPLSVGGALSPVRGAGGVGAACEQQTSAAPAGATLAPAAACRVGLGNRNG